MPASVRACAIFRLRLSGLCSASSSGTKKTPVTCCAMKREQRVSTVVSSFMGVAGLVAPQMRLRLQAWQACAICAQMGSKNSVSPSPAMSVETNAPLARSAGRRNEPAPGRRWMRPVRSNSFMALATVARVVWKRRMSWPSVGTRPSALYVPDRMLSWTCSKIVQVKRLSQRRRHAETVSRFCETGCQSHERRLATTPPTPRRMNYKSRLTPITHRFHMLQLYCVLYND